MQMQNKWLAVVALSLAACTGQRPVGTASALTAGKDAQGFGVAAYVVDGDEVVLLDRSGAELGVLTVEDVGPTARTVRIARPDGSTYEDEVTAKALPIRDATVQPDLEGTVQADPALVRFFAEHELEFRLAGAAGPGGDLPKPTSRLATELEGFMDQITFVAGCTPDSYGVVTTSPSYAWTCSYIYDFQYYCGDWCGSDIAMGSSWWDGNYYNCDCYTGTEVVYRMATCPSTNGCPNGDRVKKTRTCVSGGTCTNAANGFQGCA